MNLNGKLFHQDLLIKGAEISYGKNVYSLLNKLYLGNFRAFKEKIKDVSIFQINDEIIKLYHFLNKNNSFSFKYQLTYLPKPYSYILESIGIPTDKHIEFLRFPIKEKDNKSIEDLLSFSKIEPNSSEVMYIVETTMRQFKEGNNFDEIINKKIKGLDELKEKNIDRRDIIYLFHFSQYLQLFRIYNGIKD